MWSLYSVVYLKITIDSRIKLGDLLRTTEYLFKKYGEIKLNEKSEEEVEQGEQEDEQNEEELDAMFKELD